METATYRFQITGIDCADCAAKLERKIADIEGLQLQDGVNYQGGAC